MTLSVLAEAGILAPSGSAYQKGLNFLLATQVEDGSWHVPSRAAKFQPYFESGFPYGHDQWISSTGTAWAANALALSVEPAVLLGRPPGGNIWSVPCAASTTCRIMTRTTCAHGTHSRQNKLLSASGMISAL
jgi:hypothetical protein